MSPQTPHGERRILVFFDPDCPPDRITAHPSWNRWAAFTDDELEEIRLAYEVNFKMLEARGQSPFQSVIAAGVQAELERRRA